MITPAQKNRYHGLKRHLRAHWPFYAFTYGGIMATLLLIGFGLQAELWSFIPIGLALLLLLVYFFSTAVWSAHLLYDENGLAPHHYLFDMGKLRSADEIVYIGVGLPDVPMTLARRLTTGHITVVDIYSPQWMRGQSLRRARAHATKPLSDPRIIWQSGRLNLLPLPNASVSTVILSQTAVELHQRGDQLLLFKEIRRILAENGRFLLAERSRSQTNWIVMGVTAVRLPAANHWHELLIEAGFQPYAEKSLNGLITCYRAHKPTRAEARQLQLGL